MRSLLNMYWYYVLIIRLHIVFSCLKPYIDAFFIVLMLIFLLNLQRICSALDACLHVLSPYWSFDPYAHTHTHIYTYACRKHSLYSQTALDACLHVLSPDLSVYQWRKCFRLCAVPGDNMNVWICEVFANYTCCIHTYAHI